MARERVCERCSGCEASTSAAGIAPTSSTAATASTSSASASAAVAAAVAAATASTSSAAAAGAAVAAAVPSASAFARVISESANLGIDQIFKASALDGVIIESAIETLNVAQIFRAPSPEAVQLILKSALNSALASSTNLNDNPADVRSYYSLIKLPQKKALIQNNSDQWLLKK